jgi:hypothetical protein
MIGARGRDLTTSVKKMRSSELLALFREHLDPQFDQGILLWKKIPEGGYQKELVGQSAGSIDNKGYVRIGFRKKRYLRSRLIFFLAFGEWPKCQLDHMNRIRADDRLSNLREVNQHQNMCNRGPTRGRLLPKGVGRKRLRNGNPGRYFAQIMCHGKTFQLGTFDSVELAEAAYKQKRNELYGEFA